MTDDQARREATDLIERIALVSGPRAPTQDVNGVIVDVNDWLEAHAENPDSVSVQTPSIHPFERAAGFSSPIPSVRSQNLHIKISVAMASSETLNNLLIVD